MQFTGAKGITLFIAIIVIACTVGFGSGLLVGRKFPSHNFQKFGETKYVFDPTTGKVCDPFKDPNATQGTVIPDLRYLFAPNSSPPAKGNPIDQALSGGNSRANPLVQPDPFEKYAVKPAQPVESNYPPACGK